MPDTTPDPAAREAGRAAARAKLAALFPGQLGLDFADEIADAVLAAAEPAVRAAAIREAAEALLKVDPAEWALAGPHAGNDAAALLRRLAAAQTATTTPEEH